MLRRISISALSMALLLAGMGESRAADDPRFASDFVQAPSRTRLLRRGLAIPRSCLPEDPETPAALKKTLEFEEGRTLIDEATHSQDPDVAKSKFEQAKVKLDSFVQANLGFTPDHRGGSSTSPTCFTSAGSTKSTWPSTPEGPATRIRGSPRLAGYYQRCGSSLHQGLREAQQQAGRVSQVHPARGPPQARTAERRPQPR